MRRRAAYDPAAPLPGVHPRELESLPHGDLCKVTAALSVVAKLETLKCPLTDGWVKHNTREYYSTIKRNQVLAYAATRENKENFVLSDGLGF